MARNDCGGRPHDWLNYRGGVRICSLCDVAQRWVEGPADRSAPGAWVQTMREGPFRPPTFREEVEGVALDLLNDWERLGSEECGKIADRLMNILLRHPGKL